jgi:hypothetical protein
VAAYPYSVRRSQLYDAGDKGRQGGAGINHCMFRWIRSVALLLSDASAPDPDSSRP